VTKKLIIRMSQFIGLININDNNDDDDDDDDDDDELYFNTDEYVVCDLFNL